MPVMELYSEIPDHRDSNGNKNRSIYRHPSPDRLPDIRQDSMFFFLFTDLELRTSCHILDEKMKDFGNATEVIFHPILNGEAPEGWRKEEILLPDLEGDHIIRLYRSNRHAEQVIVHAADLDKILKGQQFFEQGCTVSTMLQRFQVAVFLYAKRIVNILVNAEVDSLESANRLKRSSDRFKRKWELCRTYFDRQNDWDEIYALVKVAVRQAESEREYFSTQTVSPPPVTIQVARDMNVAGRDMVHHYIDEDPKTRRVKLWLASAGLVATIALLIGFLYFWREFGWQISSFLAPKIPDSALEEWRNASRQ